MERDHQIQQTNGPDDAGGDAAYFETLRVHRAALLAMAADQYRTFDRAILGVSSGAFGLSIAFLSTLGGEDPRLTLILVASWVCFGLAICFNISSYLTSAFDANREVRKIDECLRADRDYDDPKNLFRMMTVWLNGIALLLFFLGVILMSFHAYQNISGD